MGLLNLNSLTHRPAHSATAKGCPPEFVLRLAVQNDDHALVNHLQECAACNRIFTVFALERLGGSRESRATADLTESPRLQPVAQAPAMAGLSPALR
jgi:hypothetical protein